MHVTSWQTPSWQIWLSAQLVVVSEPAGDPTAATRHTRPGAGQTTASAHSTGRVIVDVAARAITAAGRTTAGITDTDSTDTALSDGAADRAARGTDSTLAGLPEDAGIAVIAG